MVTGFRREVGSMGIRHGGLCSEGKLKHPCLRCVPDRSFPLVGLRPQHHTYEVSPPALSDDDQDMVVG